MLPPWITARNLIERYEVLLFDAYGVLIRGGEALPGAADLIAELNAIGKGYFVVTNGSRNTAVSTAAHYQSLGLVIPPERVLGSGSLVPDWLRDHGLERGRFLVLGPPDCHFMVTEGGGTVAALDAEDFDGLIIGNQDGFPFREGLDQVISALFKAFDKGRKLPLLLPNPDLIFPDKNANYCITGGMMALVIESALKIRFPENTPEFVRLGKPFAPIFAKAKKLAGTDSLVMIGDQMQTDIRGALAAGIDSALVGTGLAQINKPETYRDFSPTYRIEDLRL